MIKLMFIIFVICFPAISSAETNVNAKIEKASNAKIEKAIEDAALAKMREFANIITEVGKSDKIKECKSTEEKRKLIRKANHLFINGMDGHFMTITSQRYPKGRKIPMRAYLINLLNQSKLEASMPIYVIESIKINTRGKKFVKTLGDGTKVYKATSKYTQDYTNIKSVNVERARQTAQTEKDKKTMEIYIYVTPTKGKQPKVLLGDVIASEFTQN